MLMLVSLSQGLISVIIWGAANNQICCTENRGTSENLERKGKFLEYLSLVHWRETVKERRDSRPQINQGINPIFHYIHF